MNPIELNVNKTTTFLLPMLFPTSTYNEIFSNYLKQAYIGLLDNPNEPAYTILLEFDKENITPELIEDIINNLQPQGEVANVTENTIEFEVFNTTDYDTFLKGKYSQFTDEYKQTILEFWTHEDGKSLIRGILDNDKEVVDEYTPHLNREIIQELQEVHEESWPPPNLFVDELYLA